MKITLYNDQETLDVSFAFVEEVVLAVFSTTETPLPDEVILHLVDKETITNLHRDFFNDPTPTDCISFPVDAPGSTDATGHILLGEIFICPEVALEYAHAHNKNPIEETALYIIHGLLHLLGYDDIDENDVIKMRQMESNCLKTLSKTGNFGLIQTI